MRSLRIIAALLCAAWLLAGCSTLRLAYSQADHLTYWWLDGHVDFDGEQTRLTRDGIAQWFAWHRASQLPDYAALLERAEELKRGRDRGGQRVQVHQRITPTCSVPTG